MKQYKKESFFLSPIITELNHSFIEDVRNIEDEKMINISFFSYTSNIPSKEIIKKFPIVLKYTPKEKFNIFVHSFLLDNSFREAKNKFLINFVPYVISIGQNIFSYVSCSLFRKNFIINVQFFKELDVYFYRAVYINNTYIEHEWKITKNSHTDFI